MRRLLALAAALAAAGPALGQIAVPTYPVLAAGTDFRDVRGEPNVPYAGTIASPAWNEGTSYPADDNGVDEARAGVAARILDAQIVARCGPTDCALPALLDRFDDREWMLPGANRWRALHGTWADANGDGVVQDAELEGARVYANPLESSALAVGDEFEGREGARILGYLEPGNASDASGPSEPDFAFLDRGDGLYVSTAVLVDRVDPDGAILATAVFVAVSDPVYAPDGERDWVPGSGSLVDTDLHRAVDPMLEGLYVAVVGDAYDRLLVSTAEAAGDAERAARPSVGPAYAEVVPPVEYENGQRPDYAVGWHAWLDAWIGRPRAYAPDGGHLHHAHGEESRAGPGAYRPAGWFSAYARSGAWYDVNGDGWIGDAEAFDGCPDAYACGGVPDPNRYDDAESRDEFHAACLGGVLAVRVEPPGSGWGAGAYVVRDDDARSRGGNPFDDAVLDLADLDADRLVTHGPIDLTLRCDLTSPNGGRHASDELVVLLSPPLGPLVTTAEKEADFRAFGVPTVETVRDSDVVAGWAA